MLDARCNVCYRTDHPRQPASVWVLVDERGAKSISSTVLQDDAYALIFDQQGLMAGISIIEGTKISLIKRGADTAAIPAGKQGVPIMKLFHSQRPASVVLAMLLAAFPALLPAADAPPSDSSTVQLQPQEQNGITYLSGGIGLDESEAFKQIKGYNLHMTFSTGALNEYLSNVDVVIQAADGRVLLSLNQVGPIVYVKLPADKYTILARQNGQEKRSTVDLTGTAVGTVNLHWSDAP